MPETLILDQAETPEVGTDFERERAFRQLCDDFDMAVPPEIKAACADTQLEKISGSDGPHARQFG